MAILLSAQCYAFNGAGQIAWGDFTRRLPVIRPPFHKIGRQPNFFESLSLFVLQVCRKLLFSRHINPDRVSCRT
jgi:hypothetical protein